MLPVALPGPDMGAPSYVLAGWKTKHRVSDSVVELGGLDAPSSLLAGNMWGLLFPHMRVYTFYTLLVYLCRHPRLSGALRLYLSRVFRLSTVSRLAWSAFYFSLCYVVEQKAAVVNQRSITHPQVHSASVFTQGDRPTLSPVWCGVSGLLSAVRVILVISCHSAFNVPELLGKANKDFNDLSLEPTLEPSSSASSSGEGGGITSYVVESRLITTGEDYNYLLQLAKMKTA